MRMIANYTLGDRKSIEFHPIGSHSHESEMCLGVEDDEEGNSNESI